MPTRRKLFARSLWPPVFRWIRTSFPDVSQMSVDELARQLQSSGRKSILLLDVRSREEYDVSHIAGAERFDESLSDAALARRWHPDRPIVTYCSIGYRSSAAARRLASLGYENVSNLEGSLFRWVGEGHAVERQGKIVRHVHPYNRLWACLLPRHARAAVAR